MNTRVFAQFAGVSPFEACDLLMWAGIEREYLVEHGRYIWNYRDCVEFAQWLFDQSHEGELMAA